MSTPTYSVFTSDEILMMIEDLGYWAELYETADSEVVITSRCDGIAWKATLVGQAPFHLGIRLEVPLLVEGDPFQWTNNWNRTRFSQASVLIDAASGEPLLDEDGLAYITIENLVMFEKGVTPTHVTALLYRWTTDVIHIHSLQGVTYFEELSI